MTDAAWQWLAALFGTAWTGTMLAIATAVLRDRKAAAGRDRADTNAQVELARMGAAERLNEEILERLADEATETRSEIASIRRRDNEIRALLYGLLEDLNDVKGLLMHANLHLRHEELSEKRVKMEQRVREGMRLWERESA